MRSVAYTLTYICLATVGFCVGAEFGWKLGAAATAACWLIMPALHD